MSTAEPASDFDKLNRTKKPLLIEQQLGNTVKPMLKLLVYIGHCVSEYYLPCEGEFKLQITPEIRPSMSEFECLQESDSTSCDVCTHRAAVEEVRHHGSHS